MFLKSVIDLRVWVDERLPETVPSRMFRSILFAIQCHEDRPDWGTNWESFLDSLPENLFELIDCEGSPV